MYKSCTEVEIPIFWSKFRCRNRNPDSEIGIEIPKSESKFRSLHQNRNSDFNVEILTKLWLNFDFVERKRSKSKHRNFDEIRIKFRRNFDFVESKIATFVETVVRTSFLSISFFYTYLLNKFQVSGRIVIFSSTFFSCLVPNNVTSCWKLL
jgi:hypothetical protein